MPDESAEEIKGRLRKIEGQIKGIYRMVEDERTCEDVLTQLLAVRTALDKVALQIVLSHVEECLISQPPEKARSNIARALQLLSRAS
jgi:DNA-binding FrmR family transcriptional regulator